MVQQQNRAIAVDLFRSDLVSRRTHADHKIAVHGGLLLDEGLNGVLAADARLEVRDHQRQESFQNLPITPPPHLHRM